MVTVVAAFCASIASSAFMAFKASIAFDGFNASIAFDGFNAFNAFNAFNGFNGFDAFNAPVLIQRRFHQGRSLFHRRHRSGRGHQPALPISPSLGDEGVAV